MGGDQVWLQSDRHRIASYRFTDISLLIKEVGPEIVRFGIFVVYLESLFVAGQGTVIFSQTVKSNPEARMSGHMIWIFLDRFEQRGNGFAILSGYAQRYALRKM